MISTGPEQQEGKWRIRHYAEVKPTDLPNFEAQRERYFDTEFVGLGEQVVYDINYDEPKQSLTVRRGYGPYIPPDPNAPIYG